MGSDLRVGRGPSPLGYRAKGLNCVPGSQCPSVHVRSRGAITRHRVSGSTAFGARPRFEKSNPRRSVEANGAKGKTQADPPSQVLTQLSRFVLLHQFCRSLPKCLQKHPGETETKIPPPTTTPLPSDGTPRNSSFTLVKPDSGGGLSLLTLGQRPFWPDLRPKELPKSV